MKSAACTRRCSTWPSGRGRCVAIVARLGASLCVYVYVCVCVCPLPCRVERATPARATPRWAVIHRLLCRPIKLEGEQESNNAQGEQPVIQPRRMAMLIKRDRLVAGIVPRLADYHGALKVAPTAAIKSSCGLISPPFGTIRLHVLRLMSTVLAENTPEGSSAFLSNSLLPTCVDALFQYPWNSFVHACVTRIIESVVCNCTTSDQEQPPDMQSPARSNSAHGVTDASIGLLCQLFGACRISARIIEAFQQSAESQRAEGARELGYVGHLSHIANILNEALREEAITATVRSGVPARAPTWTA